MTRLSINVNKVALIRNARGGDLPNLEKFCQNLLSFNVEGLTVHPRPDARHITLSDVEMLKSITESHSAELNIEGNPTDAFIDFVCAIKPEQCTLVPDEPGQLTSDHGWNLEHNAKRLQEIILKLHTYNIRVSLFMDADSSEYASLGDLGVDAVELYTGPYAHDYSLQGDSACDKLAEAVSALRSLGLDIHAGHDLNLQNLAPLIRAYPDIKEVSIGQAFVADCLYFGVENTHGMYQRAISMI